MLKFDLSCHCVEAREVNPQNTFHFLPSRLRFSLQDNTSYSKIIIINHQATRKEMKKLKAVISIGSTSFPNLIDSILEPLTLESFIDLNIYQILLQFGHQVLNLQSHLIPHQQHHQVDSNHPERLIYDYHSKKHLNHQIEICLKAFVPDIDSELSKADLAIVHAGLKVSFFLLKIERDKLDTFFFFFFFFLK